MIKRCLLALALVISASAFAQEPPATPLKERVLRQQRNEILVGNADAVAMVMEMRETEAVLADYWKKYVEGLGNANQTKH